MELVKINCDVCGSENIYYFADMIVKGHGTMNKDGTIDEFTDYSYEKPLKYKITGYSCLSCFKEGEYNELSR